MKANSNFVRSNIAVMLTLFTFVLLFFSCSKEDELPSLIKKSRISGVIQKGPFVSGTSVLMSELNQNMEQTGNVFISQIINNTGFFEINNIELLSSFVDFSSTGFYFNEVEGQISNSPIALTAISDIRDRSSINVNILTHLEKQRVEFLIKSGKSFSEAKSQAQEEILAIFSINLSSAIDSENFDLTKNNEQGAILLAISVILQGERTVGQLTELLARIQNDISEDGILSDSGILEALRSSALGLNREKIIENLQKRNAELGINEDIPDFQKHLDNFLSYREYELIINISGEGKVEERIVTDPSSRQFPFNTTIELTPIPEEGWVFDKWEGDFTGNEVPLAVVLNKDREVTAVFKRRDYDLKLIIEGEGTVQEEVLFDPNARQYPFETIVQLTATPAPGWYFDGWSGDLAGSENPETVKIDSPKEITARFKREEFKLDITVIGQGTVLEEIEFNPNARTYPFQTVVKLTPIPEEGWVFDRWEGDLEGNQVPAMIEMVGEKNITAKFRQPLFFLSDNGITCSCTNVKPGEFGFINGIRFEAVDNSLLRERVAEGADLTKLCTSLVTDMSRLFYGMSFNQEIGNWDVSNVLDMSFLFRSSEFNRDISNWDVSKVRNMHEMFRESRFNQNINQWNVSNVLDMSLMFAFTNFNQPLNNWNVSKVINMWGMFWDTPFNRPIGDWNVSSVRNTGEMFRGSAFNQDISNWNVSKVTNMSLMFAWSRFNQPLGDWSVSEVVDMWGMFFASVYNHPLKNWNVRNVTNMREMFRDSRFNQDISTWCVSQFEEEPLDFATNSDLIEANKPIWGTCD